MTRATKPWSLLAIAACAFSFTVIRRVDGLVSIVTGANGYVGRAVVHELLSRALLVTGDVDDDIVCLVRARHVQTEQDYWNEYQRKQGAENSKRRVVRVLPYDMLDQGKSLEEALQSLTPLSTDTLDSKAEPRRVFHVASVFGPTEDHTQTALDNVRGTEDLVRTLGRVGHCQLILTSSMAAVRGTGQEPLNGKYYTAQDWNTESQLGSNWGASYQWSKAESERRAWELCRECNIPMVSLCPSFVFGPPTLATTVNGAAALSSSYSCTLVEEWLRGTSPVQSRLCVDIRNVAQAHVQAAMRDGAIGKRYIVSTEARIPSREIASWIQDVCRQGNRADLAQKIHYDETFTGGSIPIGTQEVEAGDLQSDLGISLLPVMDTISDMARAILAQEQPSSANV